MLKSKKGSFLDWFIIIPFLVFVAIVAVSCMMVYIKVNNSGIFATNADATYIMAKTNTALLSYDGLMMFMIIGLSLFVICSSYFVSNHPAFFFCGLILLIVAVTIAAQFSNAYETFISTGEISTASAFYPKTNWLIGKLPIYITFMGVLTLVVMGISYAKQ